MTAFPRHEPVAMALVALKVLKPTPDTVARANVPRAVRLVTRAADAGYDAWAWLFPYRAMRASASMTIDWIADVQIGTARRPRLLAHGIITSPGWLVEVTIGEDRDTRMLLARGRYAQALPRRRWDTPGTLWEVPEAKDATGVYASAVDLIDQVCCDSWEQLTHDPATRALLQAMSFRCLHSLLERMHGFESGGAEFLRTLSPAPVTPRDGCTHTYDRQTPSRGERVHHAWVWSRAVEDPDAAGRVGRVRRVDRWFARIEHRDRAWQATQWDGA